MYQNVKVAGTPGIIQGYHALNEFVISRGNDVHVLRLNIYINDIFLTELLGGI